ncbi:MAG TPA: phosphatase PAP2 family protein [Candidatus Paceibacterota bacterium]
MNSFDLTIFHWLNSLVFWNPPSAQVGGGGWIDTWIIFEAEFLGWWILVGASLIFIFQRKNITRWRMVAEVFFAGFLTRFVFTEVIRFFYNRPRPFEVLENINQLVTHSSGGSFPSGHVAFFSAISAMIFFYHRIWGLVFLGITLFMGMGRIGAGIHWPTDILGGFAVGIFSAWLIKKISSR